MTSSFSQNDPQTVHQTLTPKITIFRCNPGEAIYTHTHACTRTPTHPPSKNRQVRVKIIKKMKMLAQVKVNAECLINCVRENNKRRDVFLSFFFLTWRDNWEKKEEHTSEELSCLFWSLSVCVCVCVCLSLLCCVRGGERHTRVHECFAFVNL